MTETRLDERKGVPAISRGSWPWALLVTSLTGGLYALWMGIYLSGWIRLKRETGLAVYGYLLIPLLLVLGLLLNTILPASMPWDSITTALALLWIANGFVLRRELMLYYASPEGGVLEISPWLTGLFSVY
jgi:hypothetical protein